MRAYAANSKRERKMRQPDYMLVPLIECGKSECVSTRQADGAGDDCLVGGARARESAPACRYEPFRNMVLGLLANRLCVSRPRACQPSARIRPKASLRARRAARNRAST